MRAIDHPERLCGARPAIFRVGLVGMQAIDVEAGDIDVGRARDDPMGEHAAEPATGQDADGIEPCRHEVAAKLGGFANNGPQVRREALGSAEELADADLIRDRHARHGFGQEGRHALPVRRQLGK